MSTSTRGEVVVVIGAGSIGQAIARRIGVDKTILLGDVNEDAAAAAAEAFRQPVQHVHRNRRCRLP